MTSAQRHRRLRNRVVHAPRHLRHVEERHRAVGLGIEVDEQRALAAQRQRGRQVDGGRGLPHAALLVGDGDDHRGEKFYDESRRFAHRRMRNAGRSHLVFPEIVRIEALQPLVQPLGVGLVGGRIDRLGVVDHRFLDEDRRPRAQRQRDRVARPRVDRHRVAVHREVDQRVERVLLQVADDDLLDRRLQVVDHVPQQVVRHRPRRRDVLDLQRDGVRLEDADPDRQHLLTLACRAG